MEPREKKPAAYPVGLKDRSDGCDFSENAAVQARTNTSKASASKLSAPTAFSLFNNRWLLSISLVSLFVALCYGLIGLPYYETNDDVAMTAIVSGTGILDSPDEHMIWSSVYLGLLLKHLYSAFPAVPWYGIFQLTAVFASTTVITWLVTGKSKRLTMAIGVAIGMLIITCTRPLFFVQFTTSAALVACAGALLLMESVERWHLRKRAVACAIGAVLMFIISSLLRNTSTYVVLIVTTMFVVSRYIPVLMRQWRKFLAHLMSVFAAFGIVWSFSLANEGYYQDQWKDFYTTLRAAASIREYRCDQLDSPLRPLMFQQVGWTPTDSTLYLNWYGLNKNTYSAEKLATLSKAMKDHQVQTFDKDRLISTVKNLLLDPMFTILVLPVVLLVPLLNRGKVPLATPVLLSIGVFALCAYFVLCMKLPMRVFGAVIMPLTFFAIRYTSVSMVAKIFSRGATPNKMAGRIIYGTIILAALAPGIWLMTQMQANLNFKARLENMTNEALCGLTPKPNQLYVCWAANPRIIVSPFADLRKTFHNFNLITIGAVGPAPFVLKRLKDAGIDDLLGQLDMDNIFLISNDQYNRFIRMYAAEKLGKEVVFERIPVYPKVFECFKVTYVAPADPAQLKRDLDAAFLPTQEPNNTSVSSQRSNE